MLPIGYPKDCSYWVLKSSLSNTLLLGSSMFTIIQHRKTYFIISGVMIGIGLVAMILSWLTIGSPFRVGVDFRSGTRFEVRFLESTTENEIRAVFADYGQPDSSITSLQGAGLENAWQIRTSFVSPEMAKTITEALAEQIAPLDEAQTVVQSVSPAVGSEVRQAAVVAIGVTSVVVLTYIVIAFRQIPNSFRYGVCAVVAMLHDILVTFGFIAVAGLIAGWEVDALFLTAVLTVAGFSLQDTIVMFDRIRENITKRPWEDYEL